MSSMTENRSSLKEFLASIATIRGDISNITAPPFVLGTKSATEFPAYWAERPSIFCAPVAEPDPAKRALLVLKWFLAALKQQQYAGRDEKEGVKKPLNAFLGELFLAGWQEEGTGETRLVSEQVSHHPPVTACYLWNDTAGIRASGYTRQEITFNGSINIKQIGHAVVHLDKYDEDYLIPFPSVQVKNLLTGSPYPELDGTYHISSSSGYISTIDFSGKSLLGMKGTQHKFIASLYTAADFAAKKESPLYTVAGTWNDTFTIHDCTSATDIETYDTSALAAAPLQVAPLDQQDPWESRKAWAGVIDALNHGDMQGTSDAKGVVERGQRDMRKREEAEGAKWVPKFFRDVGGDEVFERLALPVGERIQREKTMGVWAFEREVWEGSRRPFRGETVPTG